MSERFHDIHPKRTWTDEALAKFNTDRYDQEWYDAKEVDVAGEKFEVRRMNPDRFEMETPILVVGGWNATDEIVKDVGRAVVGEGVSAIVINAVHGVDNELATKENLEKAAEVELRRLAGFMEALDAEGIDTTYAIGHSEGALDLLLAADIFPERFKGIALVEGAGMIADDDPIRLSLRFAADAIRSWYFAAKQGTIEKKLDIDSRTIKSILGNINFKSLKDRAALRAAGESIVASTKEVVSIGNSHGYELLRDVRAKGVEILFMHSMEDTVFPLSKIRTTMQDMKENPQEDIRNLLTGFYTIDGDHNTFLRRAGEYTRPLVQAFKSLDKNKQ